MKRRLLPFCFCLLTACVQSAPVSEQSAPVIFQDVTDRPESDTGAAVVQETGLSTAAAVTGTEQSAEAAGTSAETESETASMTLQTVLQTAETTKAESAAEPDTSSATVTAAAHAAVHQSSSGSTTLCMTVTATAQTALTSETEPPELPECRAAALYCVSSGELLYADRADEQIAPASLAKLLTAAVSLKYLSPDTVCTVGSEQALLHPHSSLCLIRPGHCLTLRDLLTGMLLASGNDAAYTAAVVTARAVSGKALSDADALTYFAGLMNSLAEEIGMKDSHFVFPDGWDDPAQHTTAADLIRLGKYVLTVPEICRIAGVYQTHIFFRSGENAGWTNTNQLLNPESKYYIADAVGLKTGTTAAAGNCLIGAFVRQGRTYLTVAAGCRSNADRYLLTDALYARTAP